MARISAITASPSSVEGTTGTGWRVSGLLRIDEVAAATGFRAPEGPYETIGVRR
ncbi:hypothetical protein MAHJHV57_50260 [Mycobacterium avium subsp. hominissuis]